MEHCTYYVSSFWRKVGNPVPSILVVSAREMKVGLLLDLSTDKVSGETPFFMLSLVLLAVMFPSIYYFWLAQHPVAHCILFWLQHVWDWEGDHHPSRKQSGDSASRVLWEESPQSGCSLCLQRERMLMVLLSFFEKQSLERRGKLFF